MHQPPTVEITSKEYFVAADRWYDFWDRRHAHKPRLFSSFLGLYHGTDIDKYGRIRLASMKGSPSATVTLTCNVARKIKMLNSPQHHAILESYRATKKFPKEAMDRTRHVLSDARHS